MAFSTIDLKEEEGICTVTLNRPQRLNALNNTMFSELQEICDIIVKSDSIRVVVLTGAGRAFCSGGDVKEMGQRNASHVEALLHMQEINRTTLSFANLPKPVISAVNGVATGAGVNLALAGDIIIATEDAKFSEIFVQVGLTPDVGGTYFLPRAVGRAIAKELVFTGKMIDAQEAQKLGLINQVVAKDNFYDVVYDMARKIAQGPPIAIAQAKSMINKSLEMDLATTLDNEAYSQAMCIQTEDHKEGVQAFLEKRKPNFKGK